MNKSSKQALKKLLMLFLNFVLFYALLRLIIVFAERLASPVLYYVGTGLYALSAGVLFVSFYILNGYTFDNRDRTPDELPSRWSDERRAEFLEKQPKRRAKAKKLIYVMMPIVVSILISYIELNFFK